jgi:hypothetical protein
VPVSIPSTMFPVFESALLMGRETTAGTAPTSFTSIPVKAMTTAPHITPIPDQAFRGSNVMTYQMSQGAIWSELTIPQSPAYGDTIGHPLFSLFGDYYVTGTASTPTWMTSSPLTPGAGPIPVTSGSVAVSGTYIQVDSTSGDSEVVEVGTGSTATSIVLNAATPLRFSHLTSTTITTVVAPYTHYFSNLNPGSSTGNSSAQPPSYTFLHRNYIAGSGSPGYNADAYLYGHITDINLEAKASDFLIWDAKALAYERSNPAANYAPSFSTVTAWPGWSSTISLAAGSIYNISDMKISISRQEDTIVTLDGSQNPYAFGAGPLVAKFNIDYDAVVNENALNYALNNTQPALIYSISNGLSGASTVSLTINAALAAHMEAPLSAQRTLWGYRTSGELLANTSDSGNSGGYSPLQVILVNSVPSF